MAEDKRLEQPLSAAELKELRELEAKATPGPWAFSPYGDENKYGVGVVMDGQGNAVEGFDDSEDGIVVESVAPEVDGYANAALIAAMRNALPRLLAMLTPPAEKAGSKGLVDGIKAISAEFGHNWMSKEQMTPISQPPADAAVREAVDGLEAAIDVSVRAGAASFGIVINTQVARTLLSHVRAAQSPRLTEAQVAALHIVWLRCKEEGNLTDVVEILESTFRAAFPGEFGKEG